MKDQKTGMKKDSFYQEKMTDYTNSDLINAINEHIVGRNAEKNRQIIRRRLIDGVTFDKLSEEFDLSVRQVKNIVYKCSDRIFTKI